MKIPRIIVAGVSSGAGKTLAASAIAHGLRKAGYAVQPFKVGPDYIDPGYLSLAAGREARNLDSWLMGRAGLAGSFARAASDADIAVIEGVMGYYDGLSGTSNRASTYEAASILRAPVVLVVDASGAARSVAATVAGFARYQGGSRIAGVILNRVASRRHEEICAGALGQAGFRIMGSIPRGGEYALESRHLGLVPPAEGGPARSSAVRAIRAASEHIDTGAIADLARRAPPLRAPARAPRARRTRARVAVALDSSFNFYYRDNLEALERAGARLEFFSPVSDKSLPDCDGLYIGGGFPEVLAGPLGRNSAMRRAVRRHADSERRAVYAECGGLMYLTRSIESGGRRRAMAGVIDARTVMRKKATLNYTRGAVARDCLVRPRAHRIRGHEFHYSQLDGLGEDTSFAYRLDAGAGIRGGLDGMMQDAVLASYGHLYFGGDAAARMVDGMRDAARR